MTVQQEERREIGLWRYRCDPIVLYLHGLEHEPRQSIALFLVGCDPCYRKIHQKCGHALEYLWLVRAISQPGQLGGKRVPLTLIRAAFNVAPLIQFLNSTETRFNLLSSRLAIVAFALRLAVHAHDLFPIVCGDRERGQIISELRLEHVKKH